jgi:transcriptional regulator with XRE-family HTH domain
LVASTGKVKKLSEIIAENLRRVRGNRSQVEFSSLIDVNQKTYSNYENGKTRVPDDVLGRVSDKFNVPLESLTKEIGESMPQKAAIHIDLSVETSARY